MKVSSIVANVEYQHPEGEIEKFKSGVEKKQIPWQVNKSWRATQAVDDTNYLNLKAKVNRPVVAAKINEDALKSNIEIVDGK